MIVIRKIPSVYISVFCLILLLVTKSYPQGVDYFLHKNDIITGRNVSTLDIINQPYWKVSYEKKHKIKSIEEYNSNGELVNCEYYIYDTDGNLSEKRLESPRGTPVKIVKYGQNKDFDNFVQKIISPEHIIGDDQKITRLFFDQDGKIVEKDFLLSSGIFVGRIKIFYEAGIKSTERWYLGEGKDIFREFRYRTDKNGKILGITESDGKGNIISDVNLDNNP